LDRDGYLTYKTLIKKRKKRIEKEIDMIVVCVILYTKAISYFNHFLNFYLIWDVKCNFWNDSGKIKIWSNIMRFYVIINFK